MTDQFRVPENLIATVGVGFEKRLVVNVSDLPALCRAETIELADYLTMAAYENGVLTVTDIQRLSDEYAKLRFPEAAPEPTCTHQAYTVNWAGRFEGPIVCDGCGLTGTAKRLRPSHDSDFSIHWVTPQPSAEPQTNAAGIDIKKFRMSENGWRCNVCREEIVSPAHPMFHVCVTPSAGERCKCSGQLFETGGVHLANCGAAGERKVPKSVVDAIGRYGAACRKEPHTDFNTLPLFCALLDEIRPLLRVPTPSAGEEDAFVTEFSCTQCGHTFRTAEGYTTHNCPSVGVSAGETKGPKCLFCGNGCTGELGEDWDQNMWGAWHRACSVASPVPPKTLIEALAQQRDSAAGETKRRRHDDAKACPNGCEGCDPTNCGFHPDHPSWRSAVGERPEGRVCLEQGPAGHGTGSMNAHPLCTKPYGHSGPHQRDNQTPWPNTSCTSHTHRQCRNFLKEVTRKIQEIHANIEATKRLMESR